MVTAITIIQLISAVVLIGVVLFQSGKNAGLTSVMGGSSDTFLARNKNRSRDARLARATKWIAIVFVVLTLILTIIH